MKEVYGDFWTYQADVKLITTNGTLNSSGECVMGAGIALQAKQLYPEFPARVGQHLSISGNVPLLELVLGTFPTKNHWAEDSDISLIKRSAETLAHHAKDNPELTYLLPRPGCGLGRRDWESEIKPLLVDTLPDNVHVINRTQ